MKQIITRGLAALLVVVLVLGLAPSANAQQGVNLGAVLQVDNDRIEAAPGVTFGAAVYSARPPRRGFDSPDLVGLFSSTLGQYPVIYRGLWLKMTVFPGGFRRLEGVDYDPSGQLGKDEKEGWEPLMPEEGGGFSTALKAERLGALPLRFRVRHRDGRDRYSLLIFTVSWVRGGTLPTAMEIMVQREPTESCFGEAVLPYLRGFIPATATRSDAGVTQQKIEVPAQTATQTVTAPTQPQPGNDQFTPDTEPIEFNSVKLSVWQSGLESRQLADRNGLSKEGRALVEKAKRQGGKDQSVTTIEVDPNSWRSVMVVLEDDEPFTAEVLRAGRSAQLTVVRTGGKFLATLSGKVEDFRRLVLNVTDSQGNLRTVSFTDRPEGQGEER